MPGLPKNPNSERIDIKDEELSEIIEDEDGDKVQIEALLIANRIRSLMENGMVTDKKTGQLRAVQYRDIVILSRSVATWGNTVAAVLKDCDIPAHVESNTGYFSDRPDTLTNPASARLPRQGRLLRYGKPLPALTGRSNRSRR